MLGGGLSIDWPWPRSHVHQAPGAVLPARGFEVAVLPVAGFEVLSGDELLGFDGFYGRNIRCFNLVKLDEMICLAVGFISFTSILLLTRT